MADHSGASEAGGGGLDFALYRYDVSLPAAIAAAAVFLVLSLLHTWRIVRHRSLYFTAFTIGGYCKPAPKGRPDIGKMVLTQGLLCVSSPGHRLLRSYLVPLRCYGHRWLRHASDPHTRRTRAVRRLDIYDTWPSDPRGTR